MATNNSVTGSYCLSKKPRVSPHIIFLQYMLKMSVSSTNASA